MINQQIKSHWRLAFHALIEALKVTFSIPYRSFKAQQYSMMVYGKLERQRELFQLFDENYKTEEQIDDKNKSEEQTGEDQNEEHNTDIEIFC